GVGIAIAATIYNRRLGVSMLAASIASVAIGYLAKSPSWQIAEGLAGFTPAMVVAAAISGFADLGPVAVAGAIVARPVLEGSARRLWGGVGLHALSTSYVGLVGTLGLLRPVRAMPAARASWSSTGSGRPRLFEDG